ncbi:DUF7096 domain-containing protein [Halegenticoccus tardaugens]|uniref:DUF7096 domain-containing protein n=1 Tax=Halegenticoccus tardaugens TaxID=2071624 RepID=UPI00100A2AB2|nr:hypothetical protein [Halegenticoccus tardaugens]
MKLLVGFLTVTLVLSSVAGAAVPADGGAVHRVDGAPDSPPRSISTPPNETNVLMLDADAVNRTNYSQPRANLSAALVLRNERLDNRFGTLRTEEELGEIDDEQRRKAHIQRTMTEVEIRTDELRSAEREALRRHGEGEIGTTELLIRLARIDAAADQLAANVTSLQRAGADIEDFDVDRRSKVARIELRTLRGPVRDEVGDVIRGDAPATRIYVETADDGFVISTITDDEYVREAYDGTRRPDDPNRRIDIDELEAVMEEHYPSFMDRGSFRTSSPQSQSSDVFIGEVSSRRTHLTAFVDRGDSGTVFKEEQRVALNRTPEAEPVSETQDGLDLEVYPSYPGGPMKIQLNDSETGDPVRANVTASSADVIGRTNEAGSLWVVAPRENVTIRAIKIAPGINSVVSAEVTPAVPREATNESENGSDDAEEAVRVSPSTIRRR